MLHSLDDFASSWRENEEHYAAASNKVLARSHLRSSIYCVHELAYKCFTTPTKKRKKVHVCLNLKQSYSCMSWVREKKK